MDKYAETRLQDHTSGKNILIGKFNNLPVEILNQIFKSTDRADLLNLAATCKQFVRPAERILWEVSNVESYAKLLVMDADGQNMFANLIIKQSFAFHSKGVQPSQLTVKLPRLEELRITYASLDPTGEVDVSGLITLCMTRLEVCRGITDNFLTTLHLQRDIEHLKIGDEVIIQGSNPADLVALVLATSSMTTLHAGALSSIELFVQLASYERLRDLKISTLLTPHDLTAILQDPLSFASLERLGLTIQASAARVLLPELAKLKSLELDLSSVLAPGETHASVVTDLFCTIGSLIRLEDLIVTIRHFEITVRSEMFKPLANLCYLKKLSIEHDLKADPYMRDVGEFLPISRLCPLTHLHLELKQRVPRIWIENLAKHHPQIEFLSLGMYVKMAEMSAHFPSLERLYYLYPDVRSNRADM
jgi:hypothetical protein